MTAAVSVFNTVLTTLFGLVYGALQWLGPFASLVGISWLGGILMVWIFGKVSNQDAIKKTRDRMSAELIGLRLFKDDLRVFFAIQFQVLGWTLRYLRYSLSPMLILMGPVILLLIQLNLHYGARPLRVGERALVKVKLRDPATLERGAAITLQTPGNLQVETQPVRIAELREVCWRVRAASPGRFDLVVNDGKTSVTKKCAVAGRLEGVSTLRTGEDWLAALLYPGEPPIPEASSVQSIEIMYPPLELTFLGWHIDWMILFFILSLCFGYAFKGMLGVQV